MAEIFIKHVHLELFDIYFAWFNKIFYITFGRIHLSTSFENLRRPFIIFGFVINAGRRIGLYILGFELAYGFDNKFHFSYYGFRIAREAPPLDNEKGGE